MPTGGKPSILKRKRRQEAAYGSLAYLNREKLLARVAALELENYHVEQRANRLAEELKASQARERFYIARLAAASVTAP